MTRAGRSLASVRACQPVVRNHCAMNPSTDLLGAAVLTRGTVDPPAHGAPVRGIATPIALDAGEVLGAVAFATWDPYPGGFEPEWWCTVELFVRDGKSWHAGGG